MNKKGVELSMNVIIIAAIGLLVLVILAVLVINAVNNTNTGMKSCNVMGGVCKATCYDSTTGSPGERIDNAQPCSNGRTCCKLLSITDTP